MTESAFERPEQPDAALASQRAELLGPVVAAQFELETAMADMARSGASTEAAQSQLMKLNTIQRQIGRADAAALVIMQASISGIIAQTQSLVERSRDAANQSERGEAILTASDARRATAEVSSSYYERKLLDPYLKFASAEDESEYRKRERDNREAIERELAKNTPEGTRRAAEIMERQLLDAGAHGADSSSDYVPMLDRARQAKEAALQSPEVERSNATSQPETEKSKAPVSDIDAALAALRAAGVVGTDDTNASGHGLIDTRLAGREATAGRGGVS